MRIWTLCALIAAVAGSALGATGNPVTDGWLYHGNSLEQGLYTDGTANYAFDMYSTVLTVTPGSLLEVGQGERAWLPGDTVLGAGGAFRSITPQEAGWDAFTGNNINALLSAAYGPKFQVKLGTAVAAWTTSTVAPNAGDGNTATAAGGDGTVHIQSSAWFHATTPLPDQETDTTWIGNSGQLMELDKPEHVRRRHGAGYYTPDASVARIIWEWDQEASRLASWQILLNTSLLDRLAPQDFQGLTPAYGDLAVLSVQDRNAAYTNGLVAVIPEPATMALLALGSIALLRRRR